MPYSKAELKVRRLEREQCAAYRHYLEATSEARRYLNLADRLSQREREAKTELEEERESLAEV